MRRRVPHLLGLGLIALFVVFPFAYTANDYPYVMHILITAFFYAILAASRSMLAGYAGQFSFGHIGFMGVGAYTAALFSHYFWLSPEPTGLCTEYLFGDTWLVIVNPIGVTSTTLTQDCLRQAMEQWGDSVQVSRMPVWLGIGLGTVMGGVFGLLIGLLVLRLRAAYLALFTLGFAEILKATISAEIEVTRGQAGMELPALFENGVTVLGHTFSKTDKLPPTSSCSRSCSPASRFSRGWRARGSGCSCVRCEKIRTPPPRSASIPPATRCWCSSSPP